MTRILVVDDEPNLIELLRGYLEHEGYDVAVAGDEPSGVRRTQQTHPDPVILDARPHTART